ncbi:MAG: PaaI family thioesterase [Tepidisphaeraceae bacterium]|jgi:acyl-coenzyme A thioesterase PaaI-like protein
MPLELPHTAGCLVCGPGNAKGLRLHLHVDPHTGIVQTRFAPGLEHIGFQGMAHGGVVATVFDEAMVWAASWAGKRFCVCGEMTVRFRRKAPVGHVLIFKARVESSRAKLIATSAEAVDAHGAIIAAATGKYVPIPREENDQFVRTFVSDAATAAAAEMMRGES